MQILAFDARNGPFDGAFDICASIFALCPEIEARNAKFAQRTLGMEGRKAGKAWRQRRGLCKLEQSLKKHSTQHNTGQPNFNPKMLYFDKGKAENWCVDSAAVSIFVVILVELTIIETAVVSYY